MLSTKFKFICFAVLVCAAAAILFVYPNLKGESAPPSINDLHTQMEAVKAEMDASNSSILQKRYSKVANAISTCGIGNRLTEPSIKAPFSPSANLCINGALANPSDPTYTRVAVVTTGSGISGAPGCNLSAQTPRYDQYGFNLTGCGAFPTVVTVTTCGPAGCLPTGNTDAVVFIYRNVPAGDPLTANGGLPAVFNPASACTNVRAANDDLTGTAVAAGGSSCNQLNTSDCLATCTGTTLTGGVKRSLGNGRFTVVVAGSGTSTTGTYNLYVDAPSAGCTVALAPTDASGNISGRVVTSTGSGISKATLTVSGGGLGAPVTLRTNSFGYYSFENLPSGGTYIVTVSAKMYTFVPSTRAVNLEENAADIDFVSEQ